MTTITINDIKQPPQPPPPFGASSIHDNTHIIFESDLPCSHYYSAN